MKKSMAFIFASLARIWKYGDCFVTLPQKKQTVNYGRGYNTVF